MASASTARRRVVLASLAGLLFVCAAAGGTGWYALRCNRDDYQNHASASWVNPSEEYLYACGTVWHSFDAGQTWAAIPSGGLPLLVRQGRIAVDRTPGLLYLGLLESVPSNLQCLLCPLTRVQPVMYVSQDGGRDWRQGQRLPVSLAGITSFRTLNADPDNSNAGWIVLVSGERVDYWATNNAGQRWWLTCEERIGFYCDPPADFMSAHPGHASSNGIP